MPDPGERGGLRVASLFFLFALSVLASGKYYQYVLGFLRGVVFLTAAAWLWRRGRICREIPAYAVAVAGFSALSLGHAFSSVYFWVSFQHSLNILLATGLLMMVIWIFRDETKPSAWKLFLPIFVLLATVEIVIAVHQRVTLGTSRPHGTFSNPMFLSECLSISALFFASRLLGEWGTLGRRRIAWGAGAVLFMAGALSLTGSRGVVVALVPALVVLAISHFGIIRGWKVSLLILPVLITLGWHSISRFFGPDVYNYGRLVFWRSALRVFEANPFGVGIGGYKYHWFATQEPFLLAFRRFGKYAVTPHNEFLEVLSGLGFAGLILFCAVLFLPLLYTVRGWRGVSEDRRWIAAGAVAGLVLTGTNALFNFNFHEFGLVFTDVLLLGILWACLPESAMGKRLPIPPFLPKAVAVIMVLLGVASMTLLAGAVAKGRGEFLVREKDYASAEKAFRLASVLDPWRATIPDELSALYHRGFITAIREEDPAAGKLLLLSIRWQEKARELCPMEQGFLYRLVDLFQEKHRLSGERRDLETALALTGEILRINPYGVEAHWNRAHMLLYLGRIQEAGDTLQRAVSVEPNFCRGYARLAQLTKGKDERQFLAWESRAAKCREAAEGRALEESERWLVEEPGPMSMTVGGRTEDGEPGSPPGFSPSR